MGYYTRVLTKRSDYPPIDHLSKEVRSVDRRIVLSCEDTDPATWEYLLLLHPGGPEIAAVERNVIAPGTLGETEITEFIDDIRDCKPSTAVPWLTRFLQSVKVLYAIQHLSGTEKGKGAEALQALSGAIWGRGDAILQADGEGFSNEDGHHILWQFSDRVSGPWSMAVLQGGRWLPFQMELGDPRQRAAFLEGRVP